MAAPVALRFLAELAEQLGQKLRFDPDSAVGNRENGLVARGAQRDADLAALGELDRVADQVGDDPVQRACIGHRGQRVRVATEGEVESFLLGQGADQEDRLADVLGEVDGVRRELFLPGVQTRKIEHGVERAQQAAPTLLDDLGELLLLGPHLVVQNLGKADHGRQRRADLMAHARQERALEPHHLLGLPPRLQELRLIRPPRAHVARERKHAPLIVDIEHVRLELVDAARVALGTIARGTIARGTIALGTIARGFERSEREVAPVRASGAKHDEVRLRTLAVARRDDIEQRRQRRRRV